MKVFLFLLVLSLPMQLGRHFWPSFSYVLGLKIDYLSPVLYLQDILILALIFGFLKNKFESFRNWKFILLTGVFILLVLGNLFNAVLPFVSLFHWFRVIELMFLGLVISHNSKIVWENLQKVLPFWLIGEYVLGLLQVLKQSSLGGVFWYLGERSFNLFTPGIAKASWTGKVFLRPYGTFSHPNSLAGFILICLVLMVAKKRLSFWGKISITCGFILLILCFSRTAWLTVFLLSLFYVFWRLYLFIKEKTHFDFNYFLSLFFIIGMVFLFSKTRIEAASFDQRQILSSYAFKLTKEHPIFGVGANNFIVSLSKSDLSWQMTSFLQPVHNIFLLTGAESGLIGLIIFITFLLLTVRRVVQFTIYNLQFTILVALLAIIFTGLFDHYWLTLIQNQLLFVLILGLAWSKQVVK